MSYGRKTICALGAVLFLASHLSAGQPAARPIKAFDLDFNWGPGGPNGFAKPGLWADADPARHVAWYKALGANVIQTFCVSCNGYAWYKNGVVPEQPGLKHDFLRQVVRLGHREGHARAGLLLRRIEHEMGQGASRPQLRLSQRAAYPLHRRVSRHISTPLSATPS